MQMWESLALPLVFICQKKIEGRETMVQAPPKPIGPEVNIELEDLKELARINPLAWEQLLHIADNRPRLLTLRHILSRPTNRGNPQKKC